MKTILITGASSGIGRETVKYFSTKGWNVAATMRNPQHEIQLNKLPNVTLFALDVTSKTSVEEAINAIWKQFKKVDVVVNNAGFGLVGIFEGASDEQIFDQFNTNVFGLMRVIRAALPHMRLQGDGRIVNVASIAGRMAFPIYSLYNASKFAVEGFTESLSFELKQFNIKVKLIEPGPIKTDFNGRSKIDTVTELPEYQEYEDEINNFYNKNFENGQPPIVVAKAIYKASTSRCNKMRYPVGYQAKIFTLLTKIVPRSWFRYITSKIK